MGVYQLPEHNNKLYRQNNKLYRQNKQKQDEKNNLQNENYNLKKISVFTYGSEYTRVKNDENISRMIQKQFEGNCVLHAINNLFSNKLVGDSVLLRPVSLIEWAVESSEHSLAHSVEDYKEGGYSIIEIETFLKRRGIHYTQYFVTDYCDKNYFITEYEKARYGMLFRVTHTSNGEAHQMCVRKYCRLFNKSTFIDSNRPTETKALNTAEDVYNFVMIKKDWEVEYLEIFKPEFLHFI